MMNRSRMDWRLCVGVSMVVLLLSADHIAASGKNLKLLKNCKKAYNVYCKGDNAIEEGKMDAKNREKNNTPSTRIIYPAATTTTNFDNIFRRENSRRGEQPEPKV